MLCIRCNRDSKYPERTNRACPGCHGRFAFEPQEGDPVSDMLFKKAVEAVSATGGVRWGVENLYYEVCRRKGKPQQPETRNAQTGTVCADFARLAHSAGTMLMDIPAQAAQRSEDLLVVGIVGAQLHSVALLHRHRDFQHVERVEPQPGAEQPFFRLDLFRSDALQVQGFDDQTSQFLLAIEHGIH